MSAKRVSDRESVAALAKGLLDPSRSRPWCVVSTTDPDGSSLFDVAGLAESVSEICEFWLVSDSDLTFYLADLLPERTNIYGNAVRVYPPGFNTDTNPFDSPRFIADESRIKQQHEQIEAVIWKLADIGKFKSERDKRAYRATATVKNLYPPSIAIVELQNGSLASVRQEVCFPEVPIDWVLEPGDSISGTFDAANNDFIPDGVMRDVPSIVEAYGFDNVILGLVKEAGRQDGLVTVFPGIDLPITRDEISGNPRDLVSDFLDRGDVISVRLYRNPQGRTRLRMDDINDDEEPLEALPVIAGGRPWLIEGRMLLGESAPQVEKPPVALAAPSEALQGGEQTDLVEALPPVETQQPIPPKMTGRQKSDFEHEISVHKQTIALLSGMLKARENELTEVNRDLADAIADSRRLTLALSEERKKNTAARRLSVRVDAGKSTTADRRNRWDNDEDWFQEELRRAWIGRYKPSDRAVFKLNPARIAFGPEFFKSLQAQHMDEDDLRKCVRVILDIVTERNAQERIHEVHPLRENASPSAANLVREDGSACLRAYLEENTPQAKRLHFWKTPKGYELSRVGLHDDLRP